MAGETFALQLKAFADKAKENANVVVRNVSQRLLADVVLRTPVGNRELWAVNIKRKANGLPLTPKGYAGGRLRNNWNTSLETPDTSTTDAIDPSGEGAISAGNAVISTYAGQDIYIMNSLPYAIPVEYGHSSQAPAGMVRVSVAEAQSLVTAAVASLPK